MQVPYTGLIDNPQALAGVIASVALLVVVIRAPKQDLLDIVRALMGVLVDIVRALMGVGPRGNKLDGRRDDDEGNPPPSLPKP